MNFGNTCYINAAVQLLFSLREVHNMLTVEEPTSCDLTSKITQIALIPIYSNYLFRMR
jgi:ubiquitin C-terminal hydrolase